MVPALLTTNFSTLLFFTESNLALAPVIAFEVFKLNALTPAPSALLEAKLPPVVVIVEVVNEVIPVISWVPILRVPAIESPPRSR